MARFATEEDLKIINSPLLWPMCDYLCMKKREGNKTTLTGRLKTGSTRHIWQHPHDGGKLIEDYASLDDLLEDGWIVD
jgi:hypothetical protein